MAVNTSDNKIVITNNTCEHIQAIDDGVRFAIISRLKGNSHNINADSVIVLNPKEFRDLVNWGRDRLYERFK